MTLSIFAPAADAPDRTALVAGGRARTYAELADRVRAGVAWLRARGLDDAPLVALRGAPEPAAIEMLHALVALGVPVLMLHPRLTAPEEATILAAAEPAGVVDGGWALEEAPSPPVDPGDDPPPPPDDGRTLAILQTSGSTGRPRGVVLSRAAFVASARASAANLGWQDDDRWLLRLPIAHVGGLSILTRCLLARRAVVLAADADAASLLATLRRARVTIVSLVPTLLARLLDLPDAPPPPSLRAVLLGGAPASADLLVRAADAGWPVLTTYGLTEACSQVTTQAAGTVNRGELGAGPPLPGMEVRIAPDGEIQVRGPSLLSGYFPPGDHPDPRTPDGWLRTGDAGRLDPAGNLHVAGRRADRIITGGENVDPVEVEQALERRPGIRQACVFGVPDDEWGEVVCAALVADAGDAARALEAAAGELAPFKRPRRFALLGALPLTRSGKVDRAAVAREAGPRLRPVRPSS